MEATWLFSRKYVEYVEYIYEIKRQTQLNLTQDNTPEV